MAKIILQTMYHLCIIISVIYKVVVQHCFVSNDHKMLLWSFFFNSPSNAASTLLAWYFALALKIFYDPSQVVFHSPVKSFVDFSPDDGGSMFLWNVDV
jgi:hypothetical protein